MQTGNVERFDASRGFPFFMMDVADDDRHPSIDAMEDTDAATCMDARRVSFSIGQGPKGSQTANIRML
ncbi:CSD domain-containing protein [Bordetella sputigena]|uniref:cold-shock protein n=1 Tax=Bordetella sputigena TaxID=1416810 RepID=UPI0039EFF9D9